MKRAKGGLTYREKEALAIARRDAIVAELEKPRTEYPCATGCGATVMAHQPGERCGKCLIEGRR